MWGLAAHAVEIQVARDSFQLSIEAVCGCVCEQKAPMCQATPIGGPEAARRTEGPTGRRTIVHRQGGQDAPSPDVFPVAEFEAHGGSVVIGAMAYQEFGPLWGEF